MTKSKFRPKEAERKEGKRKKKIHVVFDPEKRKEYLTGFQKRKQEKKARYRTHLEKKLQAEKQKLKEQARKSLSFRSSSHSILPEVETLLADSGTPNFSKSVSHEIGTKTVTISTIDTLHPVLPDLEEVDVKEEEEESPAGPELPVDANSIKMLKKSTNQLLQRSKAYKAVQKLKTKKSRRKQQQRRGTAPKSKDKKDVVERKGKGKFTKQKGGRGKR